MVMRHRIQGFTIVGLMVGLLISLLVVLSMLFVYRGVLNSVFGTKEQPGLVPSAQQDGQLASGLLSAQIALQSAGFGVPGAAFGKEIVFLQNASFDAKTQRLSGTVQPIAVTDTSGNAIAFEMDPALSGDAATRECMALWSDAGDSHGLYLLRAAAPCNPIGSNFNSLTWKAFPLVADRSQPSSIAFNARSSVDCWPFGSVSKSITGIDPATAPLQLSITYRNSTLGKGIAGSPTTLILCLTNIQS